jgi:long-chain fatty acid transport protein
LNRKKLLIFLFTVFAFFCFSESVFGNGLNNYTIGAKSQPMASAFVGIADDSSAVLFNPAGLSFNEKDVWYSQIYAHYNNCVFKYATPDAGDESDEVYYSTAFFLSRTYDTWSFGCGFYTPAGGGGFAFDDIQGIPGNDYEVLTGISFLHFVLSYRISSNLSIGGGPFIAYGMYEMERLLPSGQRYKNEFDGFAGYGGNIGIMYKPTEDLSIGFTIKSEVPIEMDGEEKIDGVKYDSEIKFKLPYYFDLGFGYDIRPNLTLGIDFCYMLWSDMDEIEFDILGDQETKYIDSWRISIGMDYRISRKLAIRSGLKFQQASQREKDQIYPGTTEMDQWTPSISFAYKIRESTELCIGPAYTFATEDDGFQEAKTRHFTISAAARFRF